MDALRPVTSANIFAKPAYDAPLKSSVLQSRTIVSGGGSANPTPQPRLVKAAHEFEASLMQELIRPLLVEEGGMEGDAGAESTLSSFAGEALGQALSDHGGLGIATRIIDQLSAASNHSGKTPVPKQQPRHSPNAATQ